MTPQLRDAIYLVFATLTTALTAAGIAFDFTPWLQVVNNVLNVAALLLAHKNVNK